MYSWIKIHIPYFIFIFTGYCIHCGHTSYWVRGLSYCLWNHLDLRQFLALVCVFSMFWWPFALKPLIQLGYCSNAIRYVNSYLIFLCYKSSECAGTLDSVLVIINFIMLLLHMYHKNISPACVHGCLFCLHMLRADIRLAPSQWEMLLQSNAVSHWLGINLESALYSYTHIYSGASLTHWGRVTHICVGTNTNISSDNGLSPGRRQAIIWTNAGILSIQTLGTNFSAILSEIHAFENVVCEIASTLSRPQCVKTAGLEIPSSPVANAMINGQGLQLISFIIAQLVSFFLLDIYAIFCQKGCKILRRAVICINLLALLAIRNIWWILRPVTWLIVIKYYINGLI